MTYRTHIVGGVLASLLVTKAYGQMGVLDFVIASGVGGFCSMIPDIDHEGSKLGRRIPKISKALSNHLGHRGLTHAPIIYILAYVFMRNQGLYISIALGFLVGALSHLLLDMFNSMGVPLFLPVSKQRFRVARIRTRSKGESIFCKVLMVWLAYVVVTTFVYEITRLFGTV